ncbi:hypothetical protein [Embleya sp. MST-111070]|uniref:hypothetical protein n=1 Tax=Embleya sp. MST-111070 TaxID=3398231 RepID=UPI003F73AA9B
MAFALAEEAVRRSVANRYELEVVGAAPDRAPIVCVELCEVDAIRLPRRIERGSGLAVALELGGHWPYHECGWWISHRGPVSWFHVGDVEPDRGGEPFEIRLPGLRGFGDTHLVTLADIDRDIHDRLGPPCCCLI